MRGYGIKPRRSERRIRLYMRARTQRERRDRIYSPRDIGHWKHLISDLIRGGQESYRARTVISVAER
jgi:hypothetical protein